MLATTPLQNNSREIEFADRLRTYQQAQARIIFARNKLLDLICLSELAAFYLGGGQMFRIRPEFLLSKNVDEIFRRCELGDSPIYVTRADLEVATKPAGVRPNYSDDEAGLASANPASDATKGDAARSPALQRRDAKVWYINRVKTWPVGKRPPKAQEDERMLKEDFGVGRDYARKLRKDHAPADWHKPGADKQA